MPFGLSTRSTVGCIPISTLCAVLVLILASLPFLAAIPATATAGDCVDYADTIHRVGGVALGDNSEDIAIVGSYAYVAADLVGLKIVDVSDPTSPTIVGSLDTPGNALAIEVAGNFAYVADNASGLLVIDISNPAFPSLTGSVNTPGNARGVAIAGNYAYVADGFAGLQVIEIANPNSPGIVGTANTPGDARDVALAGSHAYVADFASGLQVIDVSSPTMPTIVGGTTIPSRALWPSPATTRSSVPSSTGSMSSTSRTPLRRRPSPNWIPSVVPHASWR